jgi:transcription initiation factor TFIIIB Brf1 subunit/transcription initiation factor TFIIB
MIRNESCGGKLSEDIIDITVEQYNKLQQTNIEVRGPSGDLLESRKFVKRGNVKNVILAAILYYTCLEHKVAFTRPEISRFMGIESGFSEGEIILRQLKAEGKIEINLGLHELETMFVTRALLELDLMAYFGFVVECLKKMYEYNLGANVCSRTKIAALIYIAVIKQRLNVSAARIQAAAADIKYQTWQKLANELNDKLYLFEEILKKYDIRNEYSKRKSRKSKDS